MEISRIIYEAQSREEIVNIINAGGTAYFDGDEIAGQYAWDAATDNYDNNNEITIEDIEAHLEFLVGAGAKFDFSKAIEAAKKLM